MDPELRKLGIGGSDVGAILGLDENRSAFDVWADKRGGLPRPDSTPDYFVIGKALEQGVLSLYTHITGKPVEYCDVTYRCPERPWMVYTPDAFCVNEQRGVDAKVVRWDRRHKWGDRAADIPERVQLQCWWYMAATGYDVWDVVAMIGGDMPRVYTIHRDREAEFEMLAKCEEFYLRCIVGPERPPITGSEVGARWLKYAFPRNTAPLRDATDREMELLAEYNPLRVEYKQLTNRKKSLEAKLKDSIGAAEGIQWDTGRITWRNTKDGKPKVDWQPLARALMAAHVPDPQEAAALLADYSFSKPGARRMLWRDDAMVADDEDEDAAA